MRNIFTNSTRGRYNGWRDMQHAKATQGIHVIEKPEGKILMEKHACEEVIIIIIISNIKILYIYIIYVYNILKYIINILKWILTKNIWIGLIWLRKWTNGAVL
jgi:hypothetical protein